MARAKDDDFPVTHFSSPPCLMSEVDPAYMGLSDTGESSLTLSRGELSRLGDAVLNSIPDASDYADRERVVRYWNGGADRIFGFSRIDNLRIKTSEKL